PHRHPAHMGHGGYLEVMCGPMFSGKSELLVARLADAAAVGLRTVGVKPDIAADPGWIASRSGARWPAVSIAGPAELLEVAPGHDLVALDEAHFFGPELVEVVGRARRSARLVVAGLDLDFRGERFASIEELTAEAELVTRLTATCERCGSEATRSQRLID